METTAQSVARQWRAISHMTTAALRYQLDAAEDHDDLVMIEAVENELRARELDDSLPEQRQAEWEQRYPELTQPWWAFR